jgi:hypothetical protein
MKRKQSVPHGGHWLPFVFIFPIVLYAAWMLTCRFSDAVVSYNREYRAALERKADGHEYSTYTHCTDASLRYRYERHNLFNCRDAEEYARLDPGDEARKAIWQKSIANRFITVMLDKLENSMRYVGFVLFVVVAAAALALWQWLSLVIRMHWERSARDFYGYATGRRHKTDDEVGWQ